MFAAPIVRHNGHDYFVNEPALLSLENGLYGPVLPSRWFVRDSKLWARIQYLRRHPI